MFFKTRKEEPLLELDNAVAEDIALAENRHDPSERKANCRFSSTR